ncbi:hypothetical protein PspLS_10095 [Pyricularia sp. CBS 133598]|nr:hypothetical protein PspLS_10095 [Pyricularia sp. CBS 133598]
MRPLNLFETLALVASIVPATVAAPSLGKSLGVGSPRSRTLTPPAIIAGNPPASPGTALAGHTSEARLQADKYEHLTAAELEELKHATPAQFERWLHEHEGTANAATQPRNAKDCLPPAAGAKGRGIERRSGPKQDRPDEHAMAPANRVIGEARPEAISALGELRRKWLLWEQNKDLLDDIASKENSIYAMAMEIEELKAKVTQAPSAKMLKRLRRKVTEARKRFDDITQQHVTFRMQLEDLRGTLQGFSSQSEGESSPENSPHSSTTRLSSDILDSPSSSLHSQHRHHELPVSLSTQVQKAEGTAHSGTQPRAVTIKPGSLTEPSASVQRVIAHTRPASSSKTHSTPAQSNAHTRRSSKAPVVTELGQTTSQEPSQSDMKGDVFSHSTQSMVDGLTGTRSAQQCGKTATSPTKPKPAFQSFIPPQTVVVVPDVTKMQGLGLEPKIPSNMGVNGNVSKPQRGREGPAPMGYVEKQSHSDPDAVNECGYNYDTDATISLPSDSELPCEPKLARWEIPKNQRKMNEDLARQQRRQAEESVLVTSNSDSGVKELGNEPNNEPTAVPGDMRDKRVESETQTNGQDEEVPPPETTVVSVEKRKKSKKKTKKRKLSETGQDRRRETSGTPSQLYQASSYSLGPGRMTPDSESSLASRAGLPTVIHHQTSMQRAEISQPAPNAVAALSMHITPSPDQTEAGAPVDSRALSPLPAPIDFTWGHSSRSKAMTPPESVQSGFSSSMESHLHHGDCVGSDDSGSDTCTAGSNYSASQGGCQQCAPDPSAQPNQPWQWFHPIPSWTQPSRYMSRSVPADVSMQIRPPSPAISEVYSIRAALSENDADDFEPVSDDCR